MHRQLAPSALPPLSHPQRARRNASPRLPAAPVVPSAILRRDPNYTAPLWRLTPIVAAPRLKKKPRHPLSSFPASFQNELEGYLRFLAKPPLGTARRCGPSSIRQRRLELRLAASVLADRLGGSLRLVSLAQLVEPENAKFVLEAYWAQAGNRPTAFVAKLLTALVGLARYWVKPPAEALAELRGLHRIVKIAPGLTNATNDLLRKLEDPMVLGKLLALPRELAANAGRVRLSPARRVLQMRTAVAIELMLQTGMRLRELVALRVGQHLTWPHGRQGVLQICLPQRGEDQRFELTTPARDLVHRYLDRFLPGSAGERHPLLFVQRDGTSVTATALSDGIIKAIRRGLEIEMTPSDFPHLFAAIELKARPQGLTSLKDSLGHRYLQTTRLMYGDRQRQEAGRRWNDFLDQRLDQLAPRG